jgi:hypothetical protein
MDIANTPSNALSELWLAFDKMNLFFSSIFDKLELIRNWLSQFGRCDCHEMVSKLGLQSEHSATDLR